MAQMTPHTALERCVSIAVAISAGFCEEFIFRGYLQEQCRGLTGSAAAGVVLQAFSSARRTGIKAGRTW
jgi:hypothetical protein